MHGRTDVENFNFSEAGEISFCQTIGNTLIIKSDFYEEIKYELKYRPSIAYQQGVWHVDGMPLADFVTKLEPTTADKRKKEALLIPDNLCDEDRSFIEALNAISPLSTVTIAKRLNSLGRGGPPARPPVLGRPVRVYDGSEEIKIDEDGHCYTGISLKELKNVIEVESQRKEMRDDSLNHISLSEPVPIEEVSRHNLQSDKRGIYQISSGDSTSFDKVENQLNEESLNEFPEGSIANAYVDEKDDYVVKFRI